MNIAEHTTKKLIITGCARSGTTLLHALIGVFNDIKIYKYAETLPSKLDRKDLSGIQKKYTAIKRPQFHPDDERHFTLAELFASEYTVINIVRDAHDVLVSRHPDDPERYWVEPERWISAVSDTLQHFRNPAILPIKYEELVTAPEGTLERIASFLEIAPAADYEQFLKRPGAEEYLGAASIRGARGLSSSSIGNWKRDEHRDRIKSVMERNGEEIRKLLHELGYAI